MAGSRTARNGLVRLPSASLWAAVSASNGLAHFGFRSGACRSILFHTEEVVDEESRRWDLM
jgi:hypothetical protein